MTCAYCKNITICAICGKGYAEAVRADACVPDDARRYRSIRAALLSGGPEWNKLAAMLNIAPDTPAGVDDAVDATFGTAIPAPPATLPALAAVRPQGPYCAKLAGPCTDGCPTVQLTGCGGGTAGDCWRVKQPTVAGGTQ